MVIILLSMPVFLWGQYSKERMRDLVLEYWRNKLAEKEGRDLSRQRPNSLCFRYTFCIEYIDNRLFKLKYLSLFILGWLSRVLDISRWVKKFIVFVSASTH